MATATFRNNETGELLQLDERWLDRFPNDPYTLVEDKELDKLKQEQRQADVDALGAKPYAAPEDTPEGIIDAAGAGSTHDDDDEPDTPTTAPVIRDERRF